ncbi:Thiol-disulfide isomerase or thioredoxin [Tenacibaculum sp. MAR_2009_124]|uniref:tetratricopeptide repeat protein n=1 Tax=Tenacibaculum sp. MAR_2009_124 TaxID=1250059 RepID=UPI00089D749D|nr:tetratricopeptide repeat protein [Tenacibaculum sp. MAR_2009_124]SEC38507.1 Thiol-disulfide isomerase or thioredoxin [Tenacibaculum sp. MAR_2009_124]
MIRIFLILTLLSSGVLLAQSKIGLVKDENGKPMLLGKTDISIVNTEKFNWFQLNYDEYLINDQVISELRDSLNQYKIQVFYGTWCGDSKRELPKFYKVIEQAGFNMSNLEMIAVDRKTDAYKQSPNGEEKGLNIHRVPTFIFNKNGEEINRIVEFPKQDFERDILNIVTGQRYVSNYRIVEYLNKLLNENSVKELQPNIMQLAASFAEFTMGSRELNTYGYKLLRSNQIEKALFVFELNVKMYPYKTNVYDSMGEAYYTLNKFEESLEHYDKVLELSPTNKNALGMIEKIIEKFNSK